MTLQRPFRVSMLVLVLTGMVALTVSLASWAWLLGTLGAFAGIVTWTALRPRWHLRRGLATVAVVITGQVVVVEWLVAHSVLVPAAHFLLITQLVWLTQERTNRHYGWLCLMSLLQMMLAGVLSVDLGFGLCFLVYLPAGVCALLLYNLRCELERHGALRPSKMPRVGWRLLMGAGVVTVGELLLTVLVFMYFPRFGIQILQLKPVQRGERLSGFSDTVRFGELARVLDNPQVVMWVRLRQQGRAIQADRFPLLMRGIALDTYQHATWSTDRWYADADHHVRSFPKPEPPPDPEHEVIQDVALEPVDTRVLFYLPRIVHIQSETPNLDDIAYHRASHTFSSQRSGSVSLRYRVRSLPPSWTSERLRQPAPRPLREYDPSGRFTQLPDSITQRTYALARQIVADVPERDVYQRAITLQSHLKGRYRYDLDAGVRTWGVDPVEDFLFRTRAGHCEHFAAAMVVLLRSLDIPARVVTGFSG
ncbi:MAG: transglutaminaseTgpA domain-containing protein, partial [Planctomycetota bacterium]